MNVLSSNVSLRRPNVTLFSPNMAVRGQYMIMWSPNMTVYGANMNVRRAVIAISRVKIRFPVIFVLTYLR